MAIEDDFSVTRTSEREVTIQRSFAVPPMAVFEAMTTPALLRRWLSAGSRQLTVCEVDLRKGGSYRYVFEGKEAASFAMGGTYREVVPGERLVNTESYDGYDWDPLIVTTRFNEMGEGRTRIEVVVTYPSKEICDRDAPNLEQGAPTYRRLAEVLASREAR